MSKKVPRIGIPPLVWPGSQALPTVHRQPGPGPLQPKMAKVIQRARQANVIQCGHDSALHWEGEADELVDLMEVWRPPPTPPRPFPDFLKVDRHMPFVSPCAVVPELFKGFQGMNLDLQVPYRGSIMKVQYKFGAWNVFIPWPSVWLLRGEGYCPAPNRYGFVPSAEFGDPTFMGETSTKTNLGRVAPFPYATLSAGTYTPEVDFVFGESIPRAQFIQALNAVRSGTSVATAVSQVLGRS